jgi:hypothetical protein
VKASGAPGSSPPIAHPMPARKSAEPPEGLPTYRILTGPDDAAFCRRVSEALAMGYVLHGSPAATFDGKNVIVAQAIVWPGARGTATAAKRNRRAG